MHMQGLPRTMQEDPYYPRGVVQEIYHWFQEKITFLINSGIKREQIILDPR